MIERKDIQNVSISLNDNRIGDTCNLSLVNKNKKYDVYSGNLPLYDTYKILAGYNDEKETIFSGWTMFTDVSYEKFPYLMNISLLERWALLENSNGYFGPYFNITVQEIINIFATEFLKIPSSDIIVSGNFNYQYKYFEIYGQPIIPAIKQLVKAHKGIIFLDAEGKLHLEEVFLTSNVCYTIPKEKLISYSYSITPKEKISNAVEVRGRSKEGEIINSNILIGSIDLSHFTLSPVRSEDNIKQIKSSQIYSKPRLCGIFRINFFDLWDYKEDQYYFVPTSFQIFQGRQIQSQNWQPFNVSRNYLEISWEVSDTFEGQILSYDDSSCTLMVRVKPNLADDFDPYSAFNENPFLKAEIYGDVYLKRTADEEKMYYSYKRFDYDRIQETGFINVLKIENQFIETDAQAEEVGNFWLDFERVRAKPITVKIPFNPLFERGDLVKIEEIGKSMYVFSIQHQIDLTNSSHWITILKGYIRDDISWWEA